MSTFHERKAERTENLHRWVYGWRLRKCTACAGSGYYDNNGSPPCSGCDGTGRERYKYTPAAALAQGDHHGR